MSVVTGFIYLLIALGSGRQGTLAARCSDSNAEEIASLSAGSIRRTQNEVGESVFWASAVQPAAVLVELHALWQGASQNCPATIWCEASGGLEDMLVLGPRVGQGGELVNQSKRK